MLRRFSAAVATGRADYRPLIAGPVVKHRRWGRDSSILRNVLSPWRIRDEAPVG
jgi:hypothetical protein